MSDGPAWVASVVNAVGQSSYWNSTAIVILGTTGVAYTITPLPRASPSRNAATIRAA